MSDIGIYIFLYGVFNVKCDLNILSKNMDVVRNITYYMKQNFYKQNIKNNSNLFNSKYIDFDDKNGCFCDFCRACCVCDKFLSDNNMSLDVLKYDTYNSFPYELSNFPYEISHSVIFPKYTGININMMPIKLGQKNSIPTKYHEYLRLIYDCNIDYTQFGKIGYLTITETFVKKGESQRRSGLHTESQGINKINGKVKFDRWGGFTSGGIYMASNISNSCKIYKAEIDNNIIGKQGNIEFLRNILDNDYESFYTKKNTLYWIKDTTPHESLPVENDCYRQFFRLVCSDVSIWYSKNSTENEYGITPDTSVTTIINESKF